jgi:hypothetical protein
MPAASRHLGQSRVCGERRRRFFRYSAHSPALFQIKLCKVADRRRRGDQANRCCLQSLLADSPAALDRWIPAQLKVQTAVLLRQRIAVLSAGRASDEQNDARTFEEMAVRAAHNHAMPHDSAAVPSFFGGRLRGKGSTEWCCKAIPAARAPQGGTTVS